MKFREIIRGGRETIQFWKNYCSFIKRGKVDESFMQLETMNWLLDRKNVILSYYEKSGAGPYAHELSGLRKSLPLNMTCDVEDYREKLVNIESELNTVTWDVDAKMFYIIRNGKKLYFKKSIDTRRKVEEYYTYLAYEQTVNSPHKYESDTFCVKEHDFLADCGAAEGFFGLDNIELVDKLYIFECDEEWIEALRYTFSPYGNKVEIIPKFLGTKNDEKYISLDTYFADKKVTFIKMDLEGCEHDVLLSANSVLQRGDGLKLAITVYHNQVDEEKVLQLLNDTVTEFKIERSNGYLLHGWEEAEPPYFRTGILRIEI